VMVLAVRGTGQPQGVRMRAFSVAVEDATGPVPPGPPVFSGHGQPVRRTVSQPVNR